MVKKQNSKLGIIGSIGLAGLTAISGFTPPVALTNPNEINITQQQKETKQVPAPIQQAQIKDQLPAYIGGLEMGGKLSGFGIPPHIYGMYHVRARTHNRTNKI